MYQSTKILELGSCCFRQEAAKEGRNAGTRSHRCSYTHGYLLRGKFEFSTHELDHRNWCVDYGGLSGLKEILKAQFDHTLLCAKTDSLLPLYQELHDKGGCDLRIMDSVGIEKTAEWCYHAAQKFVDEETKGRCWVSKVEVWEHELNSAIYIPDHLK